MTHPKRIDPERIAALIDGRLSKSEAAAVRRELASADNETLAAFGDAVAIARELSSGQPTAETGKVASLGEARFRGNRRWIVPAVAAAAVIMLVFAWQANRQVYPIASYAQSVTAGVSTSDGPVWSQTRGEGDAARTRISAARIGATLTDLEIDASRNAPTAANATRLIALLDEILGGAQLVRGLPSSPDSLNHLPSERVERIGRGVLALPEHDFAVVGAYLEAAQLATAGGDASFFSTHPPKVLASLGRAEPSIPTSAKEALDSLQSRLGEQPRDGKRLHEASVMLLRALTQ